MLFSLEWTNSWIHQQEILHFSYTGFNYFFLGISLGKLALTLALINPVSISLLGIISVPGLTFLLVTPISLCVGHCKRRWFLPTPGIGNPYKQVRSVTNFARKHKVPVHRSAFTYWEEDIPSGLDLGKNNYIWWALHNRTGGRCQSILWNIGGPTELGTIFHGKLCCIRFSLSVCNPYGRSNSTLCISSKVSWIHVH